MRARLPSVETHQNERLGGIRGRTNSSGMFNSEAPGLVSRVDVLYANQVELGVGEQLGTSRMLLMTEEQRTQLAQRMEFALGFQRLTGPLGNESIQEGPQAVGKVEGIEVYVGAQERATCWPAARKSRRRRRTSRCIFTSGPTANPPKSATW